MAKVDFFADIVETRTVLGVDEHLGPDLASEVFGSNCGENFFDPNFWRDYGFLEIFWTKRPHGRGYSGHHFTFQTHRLGFVPARVVSRTIWARHGLTPFKHPLLFVDLKAELDRRGVTLVPVGEPEFEYQTYVQPESGVEVMVLIAEDGFDVVGSVQKIASPYWRHSAERHRCNAKYSRESVMRSLEELLPLSDDDRASRVSDDPDWWLSRCLMANTHAFREQDLPDRREWVRFALWAWEHGVRTGTVDPALAAIEKADVVHLLDDWRPERYDELRDLLPSAESLVADCLNALPRSYTAELTYRNKNLIDAAFNLRHAVSDATLLRELDARVAWRHRRARLLLPQ
ncbi:hypothetical protein NLX83_09975 [Allokutzneria sp. A3M-2-11 16]|uniref:hypothetical protein n=1 Tax=Allokutzneria sp. A3M-2-11 16 TaxID=2962043 RepID=UPI0020B6655B|nr:hypothetical protein [Allokutzneria sp. A3M-2-11 16]MCP3799583.1 hypothetical protein [Allokutzneria sp. A3M-2-11 16]